MSINLARLIASNFSKLGKPIGVKPCTLIKQTPGTRTPGAISAGTNPTTTSYAATGVTVSLTQLRQANTLISGVDTAIMLFGASIAGGAVPAPTDRIVFDGVTYTIVGDSGGNRAVEGDSVGATWVCQCRK